MTDQTPAETPADTLFLFTPDVDLTPRPDGRWTVQFGWGDSYRGAYDPDAQEPDDHHPRSAEACAAADMFIARVPSRFVVDGPTCHVGECARCGETVTAWTVPGDLPTGPDWRATSPVCPVRTGGTYWHQPTTWESTPNTELHDRAGTPEHAAAYGEPDAPATDETGVLARVSTPDLSAVIEYDPGDVCYRLTWSDLVANEWTEAYAEPGPALARLAVILTAVPDHAGGFAHGPADFPAAWTSVARCALLG